jgi:uncharacterized protein YdeI (YjbR/CyaY-like superfamily)
MPAVDHAPYVAAEDRASWRAWLEANHATATGAWLVTWRAGTGHPVLDYESAVEEAVCFGWIDSRTGRVDHERTKLYFAPRQPRSSWSASNKARVERLTAAGRMASAGLAAVQRAKASGTWQHHDAVERLDIPADLEVGMAAQPGAAGHFAAARRPATRAARITETAILAGRNERANQRRPKP